VFFRAKTVHGAGKRAPEIVPLPTRYAFSLSESSALRTARVPHRENSRKKQPFHLRVLPFAEFSRGFFARLRLTQFAIRAHGSVAPLSFRANFSRRQNLTIRAGKKRLRFGKSSGRLAGSGTISGARFPAPCTVFARKNTRIFVFAEPENLRALLWCGERVERGCWTGLWCFLSLF
jgi:hypothetical protein